MRGAACLDRVRLFLDLARLFLGPGRGLGWRTDHDGPPLPRVRGGECFSRAVSGCLAVEARGFAGLPLRRRVGRLRASAWLSLGFGFAPREMGSRLENEWPCPWGCFRRVARRRHWSFPGICGPLGRERRPLFRAAADFQKRWPYRLGRRIGTKSLIFEYKPPDENSSCRLHLEDC